MASAKDELAALKVRAGKKQGGDRITIINHTAGTTQSCTVTEGIPYLAGLVDKGAGQNSIHVVDAKAEKERKLTNPKNSTKRIFNCRTPEQWKELNVVLEPYYEEAIDPHIAIDLVIKALAAFSRATIAAWVKAGRDEHPGPPKAEPIPGEEWFQPPADGELPDFLKD